MCRRFELFHRHVLLVRVCELDSARSIDDRRDTAKSVEQGGITPERCATRGSRTASMLGGKAQRFSDQYVVGAGIEWRVRWQLHTAGRVAGGSVEFRVVPSHLVQKGLEPPEDIIERFPRNATSVN